MRSPSVVDQLFERLTTLSNQLESAVELSRSLQAQHAAAQSTISVLESKVIAQEGLIKSSPSPIESTCPTLAEPAASPPPSPSFQPDSLTQMLNEWKQTVEGQWSSVCEEWASERERLASAREEWETKVRPTMTSLRATTRGVEPSPALTTTTMTSCRCRHQLLYSRELLQDRRWGSTCTCLTCSSTTCRLWVRVHSNAPAGYLCGSPQLPSHER